jgi:hypothetical protein
MKLSDRMQPLVLALLLALGPKLAVRAQNATAKQSIPKIARIGKVRIGYSTQEDLAKAWGEGKTVVGGHPNSGRLWRVKGTPWILETDGFDYSKRGLVVDDFTLYADARLIPSLSWPGDVPETRLAKKDFAWGGEIAPGMAEEKVRQILKRKALPVTPTKDGCATKALGFYPLTSIKDPLRVWTASFVFTNGRLSRLDLGAAPNGHE